MSARKPLPVGSMAVEIYGRKAYGARLEVNPDRFGYEYLREWCDRRYSLEGRKGQWVILARPGFYEVVTYTQFTYQKVRQIFAFDGQTLEEVPAERLAEAIRGPLPGEPGQWFGNRCKCGELVETFDDDGWPRCASHSETAEVA